MTVHQMTPPWDRRPDEPDDAWAAFVYYRDMVPSSRNARRAAETAGLTAAQGRTIRYKYEWEARVRHHDKWKAQHKYEEKRQNLAEMHKSHSALAKIGLDIVTKKLETLSTEAALFEMPLKDTIALFKFCVEIERTAAGYGVISRQPVYRADLDDEDATG